MCFSATASFVAGGALSTVGAITLKKTKSKREIPFAAIPLLFGIQQLVEGVVWITFATGAVGIHTLFSTLFALFAYVLWPTLIPTAILMVETKPWRKKALWIFWAFGISISSYLLYSLIAFPISPTIEHKHIVYALNRVPFHWFIGVSLYVAVTCVSALFSSHRLVRLFGATALGSLIITILFFTDARVSVWCFFAALTSSTIYLFISRRTPSDSTLPAS